VRDSISSSAPESRAFGSIPRHPTRINFLENNNQKAKTKVGVIMHAQTLLLTPWYAPHKVLGWQHAVTLAFLDKVDVVVCYDDEIRSPSLTIKMPAVVRLKKKIATDKRGVKFSRLNVYVRDGFTCAYCETKLPMSQLTYDHVVPRSRGGKTDWLNIVTACYPCNAKKGMKTPADAGMRLKRPPFRPPSLPLIAPLIDPDKAPAEWRDFVHAGIA
jgi:5-methylcytosine-specific restriction endonuclease McrA